MPVAPEVTSAQRPSRSPNLRGHRFAGRVRAGAVRVDARYEASRENETMSSILETAPALDEFKSEATASPEDRGSPPPVFDVDLRSLRIASLPDFSFRKFNWLASMLAILFAGYWGIEGLREAQGAPQQAA